MVISNVKKEIKELEKEISILEKKEAEAKKYKELLGKRKELKAKKLMLKYGKAFDTIKKTDNVARKVVGKGIQTGGAIKKSVREFYEARAKRQAEWQKQHETKLKAIEEHKTKLATKKNKNEHDYYFGGLYKQEV